MKMKRFLSIVCILLSGALAFAQSNTLKFTVLDADSGEPVGYATASLTAAGASRPVAYSLTDNDGKAVLSVSKKGSYTLKVELLGYQNLEKKLDINGPADLGKLNMKVDSRQLDAATVSATGNPIIIKKDTIEYNASSFKTTDNDVLEDLLKKLPGVEVGEDGGITVNGETVKKITIDGKTFFLDDPQLASKNIPAKIVNKLKVVEKKSDQSEFTGIDDGEHETVIDLSIKPGMMKGAFGNVMAGGGHDVPADAATTGDWRYQGAAFVGKFTDKQQLSLILNGNNTNNRGFNDLSGSMMGNMRGGGGGRGRGQGGWGSGNGITTSYMGGVNGAWTLFDGDMDLGSNYLFNYTDKAVQENSVKHVYQKNGDDLVYKTGGDANGPAFSNSVSRGHRFGVRLEHKFSEKTSILFEPRVDFGTGAYGENSVDTTFYNELGGRLANTARTNNFGENKNVSTSGFLLFRQRLGIPGRTLTVMARGSFSNNDLIAENHTSTKYYDGVTTSDPINQHIDKNSRTASLWARATYTEPIGNHFYVEGNYSFSLSRNTTDKNTLNMDTGLQDMAYSNNVVNLSRTHDFGGNMLYQTDKMRAQLGVSVQPNVTTNETTRYDATKGSIVPMVFNPGVRWNWAPQAMIWAEPGENFNFRVFYRGRTSQPTTTQLMPVPDVTDPLNMSFGNPSLAPYFSHSLRGDARYNNKKTFLSFNIRLMGDYVKDPIVSMLWYNNGAQYTMPFNSDKPSYNISLNGFFNIPIAKSKFSIMNFTRASWNSRASYVGNGITAVYDPNHYYEFMDEVIDIFNNPEAHGASITLNGTRTLSVMERLRGTYRSDHLELQLSGRTRISRSWYDIASVSDRTTTFNNQIRATANWTWDAPGITLKGEFNYNWYNGYSTQQPDEYVLNAEIQKYLFKKKFTLALKGYDILGQAKNLTVTDNDNYHSEVLNNTLGRYIILSLTYRFGTMDRSKMQGGFGGPGRRF